MCHQFFQSLKVAEALVVREELKLFAAGCCNGIIFSDMLTKSAVVKGEGICASFTGVKLSDVYGMDCKVCGV